MIDENKPQSGWLVKSFWKSWSWLVSVAGFVLAVGPDLANIAVANMGAIATVFPEMSLRQKAVILLCANVLVIILRPVRQPRAMRPEEGETREVVSVNIPESIVVDPGGASLEVEVERHDSVKADPGPLS